MYLFANGVKEFLRQLWLDFSQWLVGMVEGGCGRNKNPKVIIPKAIFYSIIIVFISLFRFTVCINWSCFLEKARSLSCSSSFI